MRTVRKHALSLVAATVLGTAVVGAQAALVNGVTLSVGTGSYFVMEVSPGFFLPTNVSGYAGMTLGTSQATGASHTGSPTGTEAIPSSIDNPWSFFGNTGLDFTVSPTNVLSASGNTATIDMSGWRVTWNGIPSINMGGGAWNNASAGWSGNINGVAQITCGVDCGYGDTYTLQYTATVPVGDPSGFGGVHYGLHLQGCFPTPEGCASIIPIPAAAWLFGSGLVGLIGAARLRRRRSE